MVISSSTSWLPFGLGLRTFCTCGTKCGTGASGSVVTRKVSMGGCSSQRWRWVVPTVWDPIEALTARQGIAWYGDKNKSVPATAPYVRRTCRRAGPRSAIYTPHRCHRSPTLTGPCIQEETTTLADRTLFERAILSVFTANTSGIACQLSDIWLDEAKHAGLPRKLLTRTLAISIRWYVGARGPASVS